MRSSTSTSTTARSSRTRCPVCPKRAAAEGLTPLALHAALRRLRDHEEGRPRYMKRPFRGGARGRSRRRARPCLHARAEAGSPNIVPLPTPEADGDGRRLVGVEVDGQALRASRRRAAGSSSIPARWPSGVGTKRRSRPTSGATFTRRARAGAVRSHLHLPSADSDPHAQRQREVAGRDRAHESAVDAPRRCRADRRAHRRSRPRRDGDRPLRRAGVGHRGNPARASSPAAITWAAGGRKARSASAR